MVLRLGHSPTDAWGRQADTDAAAAVRRSGRHTRADGRAIRRSPTRSDEDRAHIDDAVHGIARADPHSAAVDSDIAVAARRIAAADPGIGPDRIGPSAAMAPLRR